MYLNDIKKYLPFQQKCELCTAALTKAEIYRQYNQAIEGTSVESAKGVKDTYALAHVKELKELRKGILAKRSTCTESEIQEELKSALDNYLIGKVAWNPLLDIAGQLF